MANVAPGGGGGAENLAQKFLSLVHGDIGDPYVFGAAGPKEFDCSGLIFYNLNKLGIKAPRTSEEQWAWVQRISKKDLQPGDLIFMQFPGDQASPGHVVIYAGNNKIIQAPHTGADVQEVPLSALGNGSEIVGYGRPPGLTGTAAPVGGSGGSDDFPALSAIGGMTLGGAPLGGLEQLGKDALGVLTGPGQTIGDIATAISGVVKDMNTLMRFLAALGEPSLWLRIGAFIVGMLSLGTGLYVLAKAVGAPTPKAPSVIPIPV